jgi:hypothetical protein
MPQGEIEAFELREQDHFRHLNRALHRAIRQASAELKVGERGTFALGLELVIKRENPGWADGYKVVLTKKTS